MTDSQLNRLRVEHRQVRRILQEIHQALDAGPLDPGEIRAQLAAIEHQLKLSARALRLEPETIYGPGDHPDEVALARQLQHYAIVDRRDPPTLLSPIAEDLGALAEACALVARREGAGSFHIWSRLEHWGTLTVTAEPPDGDAPPRTTWRAEHHSGSPTLSPGGIIA